MRSRTTSAVPADSPASRSRYGAPSCRGKCSSTGMLTVSRPVGGVLSSALRRLGDHLSVRPTSGCSPGERAGHSYPTFGLAPGGVYRATPITRGAGGLLHHRFTLTCARLRAIGGLFSVALSFGSLRLAVSQHPALRSPDLPRRRRSVAAVTWPTHRRLTIVPGSRPNRLANLALWREVRQPERWQGAGVRWG